MAILSLNLEAPAVDRRSNPMENPSIPLNAAFLSMGIGGYTDSNEVVTEQSSLEVPTVLACVRILSEGIGSLPMRVRENLARGQKPAPSHPLYWLLTQEPNPEMTAITFFSTMMTHAALWQSAYAEIERNSAGQVIALWPRMPWRTKAARVNGRIVFKSTDTPNGTERIIQSDDMIHITGFTMDGLTGSSLIRYCRQSIGLAMVAAKFGARYFANGARPGYFLQPDSPLSPEDMTLLRQDVELLSSGANVHRIGALPPGVKVVNTVSDPTALAEYVAVRKFEREEICSYFRVPGYWVGAAEKVLKATVEAQSEEFLTYSLRPWIERFEQEFQRKLIPSIGRNAGKFTLKFFTEAMLSVDKSTRYTCYTQGRTGGWLSANMVLESEGMEPIPGGDEFLVPLNTVPASQAVEPVETDESPDDAAPSSTRARTLYTPLFADAFARLQNRNKCDFASITQALTPITASLGAYFRTSGTVGAAETAAVAKYFKGLETRVATTDVTTEMGKLVKSMVFAVELDNAQIRAEKVINDSN